MSDQATQQALETMNFQVRNLERLVVKAELEAESIRDKLAQGRMLRAMFIKQFGLEDEDDR